MFAKKRSIVILREFLNPKYRVTFSIGEENYLMDLDAVITLNINAINKPINKRFGSEVNINFDLERKSSYKVTVHKKKDDGYMSWEDYREFDNYDDLMDYIQFWKKKAE